MLRLEYVITARESGVCARDGAGSKAPAKTKAAITVRFIQKATIGQKRKLGQVWCH
jgi:hypothetical protein